MRLLLEDASNFSKCPAYFNFLKKSKKIPTRRIDIFKFAIQKAYSYQMNGKKPQWRTIMGWIDSQVFKDIDVTSDEAIEKGRKLSESILIPIRNWYENSFLSEHIESYINTPIESTIGKHQFHTIAPIIKLSDPITIVIMDTVVTTQLQLYNDLIARGTGLIASKQFKHEEVVIEHMLLGPSSALEKTVLNCDKGLNSRTQKVLTQVADQIADGIDYPSITTMCNSCQFRKDCIL